MISTAWTWRAWRRVFWRHCLGRRWPCCLRKVYGTVWQQFFWNGLLPILHRMNHFIFHLNQNQVNIGVVQVEFTHSNKTNILRIMDAAGYDNPFNLLEDLIFVKRGKQFKWKTVAKLLHFWDILITSSLYNVCFQPNLQRIMCEFFIGNFIQGKK